MSSASTPTVSTQYPLAQKWLPQYGLSRSYGNLLNNLSAVRPLTTPISFDIDTFGGTFTNKCTWSGWTFNSTTWHRNWLQNTSILLCTSWPITPFNTRYRYFGTHIMWYWQCHSTCVNFWNLLMLFPSLMLWGQLSVGFNMSAKSWQAKPAIHNHVLRTWISRLH